MNAIGGVVWDEPDRWAELLAERTCPICVEGPGCVVVERRTSWITSYERVPVRGYVCVVAKRHVVEPFELRGEGRAAFCEDVLDAAERVAALVRPIKVNYEIHGNSIPHLHAHVYPRFRGDRFVGGPIDTHCEPVENVDLATLRRALA